MSNHKELRAVIEALKGRTIADLWIGYHRLEEEASSLEFFLEGGGSLVVGVVGGGIGFRMTDSVLPGAKVGRVGT